MKMHNLLSSTNTMKSTCQLIETHDHCWILRANQEKSTVVECFAHHNIRLPAPTQLIVQQLFETNVTSLGVSTDESWWLIPQEETQKSNDELFMKLHNIIQEHNQANKTQDDHSSLAFINQSDAYKSYQLNGGGQNATELLTHLIPYDWYGLQSQVETQSQNTPRNGKAIASVMQSVPIVVCSVASHQYKLLIRRSFADYAIHLIQHTAKLSLF